MICKKKYHLNTQDDLIYLKLFSDNKYILALNSAGRVFVVSVRRMKHNLIFKISPFSYIVKNNIVGDLISIKKMKISQNYPIFVIDYDEDQNEAKFTRFAYSLT